MNPNEDVHKDINIEYSFTVSESLKTEYKLTCKISEWLNENLENLTDDKGDKLFSKVNFGYNEESLKGFGAKPVCDVYVNNVDYTGDFEAFPAESVHSIIIFYMKGANNKAYLKACELHDYLIQEFIENRSFRHLDDTVRDTTILNSELMNQPIKKKWGVMGALELSHLLY